MKTKARVFLYCLHPWAGTCCFDALWAGHSAGKSDDRQVLMSPSFRVCSHFAVKEIATLINQKLPQGPTVNQAVSRPLVAWPGFLSLPAEHMD